MPFLVRRISSRNCRPAFDFMIKKDFCFQQIFTFFLSKVDFEWHICIFVILWVNKVASNLPRNFGTVHSSNFCFIRSCYIECLRNFDMSLCYVPIYRAGGLSTMPLMKNIREYSLIPFLPIAHRDHTQSTMTEGVDATNYMNTYRV